MNILERIELALNLSKQSVEDETLNAEADRVHNENVTLFGKDRYGIYFEFWKICYLRQRQSGLEPLTELFEELISWEDMSMSPFSYSIYSSSDITWGYKPEGSYRIADHWGWEDQFGGKHCEIHGEDKPNNNLLLAQFMNGKYTIIQKLGVSL